MSMLLSSIQIKTIQLKNRIVVSPMCQYSAENGFANDWHLVHLGSRAVGGAGLVFTEAVAILPEGRISAKDLGLWNDEQVVYLKRITDFIHAQGAVAGIQLAHAGRKASLTEPWAGDRQLTIAEGGWDSFAPSPIPFSENHQTPLELTKAEIDKIVHSFRLAAKRCIEAGFKIIEIHAAHGYLIHEFLSPLSNKRTDEFGGNFENRIRFLLMVIEAIRKELKEEFPLFLRISATDWIEGGWNLEDSLNLSTIVKRKGVDLIDCSTGGVLPNIKIPAKLSYQVPFSKEIKKTGILTGAVGIIINATQAENILKNDEADLIFMAREFLRNPYFPMQAAKDLNEDINFPKQYERAKRKIL